MPVATYLNDPAHEAQADRVRAEVEAHGIRTATTCSAGCALSVAQSRAMEAIQIVDAVVTREHLDVSVVVPPTS
jgi:hypothetical protein